MKSKSKLVALTMLAFTAFASSAQSSENGLSVYPLGLRGPLAGAMPPPGLYFQNDLMYYKGSADASKSIPINGKLLADIDGSAIINIPTLLWSLPYPVLGGNLIVSASLPFGGPRINAGLQLAGPLAPPLAVSAHDSTFTIGDPFVTTAIAWHKGNFHWTAGVGVNIPVGDYDRNAIANISFNRWAADLFAAATYLDMKTGLDLSAAWGFTFNGENPATNYRTGTEFHLELAAIQNLPNGFSFGLVGYYFDQLTGDSGSGAVLGPFKGRVAALGAALGYTFKSGERDVMTRLRVYREFEAVHRLEGTTAFLTVAMPLQAAAPKR